LNRTEPKTVSQPANILILTSNDVHTWVVWWYSTSKVTNNEL